MISNRSPALSNNLSTDYVTLHFISLIVPFGMQSHNSIYYYTKPNGEVHSRL